MEKVVNENREKLIEMSLSVRSLVEEGEFETINQALTEGYKKDDPTIRTFKTFHEWRKEGWKVVKGSKAFLCWGRKRKVKIDKSENDELKEYAFFPLCYLFSNNQVQK